MTLAMLCKIVFPAIHGRKELVIRKVESISLEKGWEMLTDTAEITMPRAVKLFKKTQVRDVFKKGDPVRIYLGYDREQDMKLEFTGYVTETSAEVPIKLKLEDEMYQLKKHSVNHAMKSTKLKDLIAAIVPAGTETDVADFELSKERFPNTTAAKVLEQLQEDNIYSYFKGKTLVVGKVYIDDEMTVNFDFKRNVRSNDLKYRRADDILILVKGTSTLPKGQTITAEFGDQAGTQKNLSYYNIESKDALQVLCEEDYNSYKSDGYEGDFKAWGIPFMAHGFKVNLTSEEYPDRNGIYWVKKVKKEFSKGAGFRQVISLDKRASDG